MTNNKKRFAIDFEKIEKGYNNLKMMKKINNKKNILLKEQKKKI